MVVMMLILESFRSVDEAGNALSLQLEAASTHYDLAKAEATLNSIREAEDDGPTLSGALAVRAYLLVAELNRIAYEETPESQRSERRAIANRIDSAAQAGLDRAKLLPEDSWRYRETADLYGCMIRTRYQGKKYRGRMERAADKAIDLDPKNARAYVSRAKPYLFAKENQGGDVEEAIVLLESALSITPTLESANLLLAYAYEEMGDTNRAETIWRGVLARNPSCLPAQNGLARIHDSLAATTGHNN